MEEHYPPENTTRLLTEDEFNTLTQTSSAIEVLQHLEEHNATNIDMLLTDTEFGQEIIVSACELLDEMGLVRTETTVDGKMIGLEYEQIAYPIVG